MSMLSVLTVLSLIQRSFIFYHDTGNDYEAYGTVTNSSFNSCGIGERIEFQGSSVSRRGRCVSRFVIMRNIV